MGFRSGSDDHGSVVGRAHSCAEVAGGPERAPGELIDPDAVMVRIDDVQQLSFEDEPLRGITDNLEDGLLDTLV